MDTIQRAASKIAFASRVGVLTGAGISAESGLPTFRGAGGLWRGMDPTQLATPEAFRRDPALVWEFYNWRRELVAKAQPNAGHLALVQLEGLVPSFRIITQNVDRLHHRAGSRDVLELHGNLNEVRCTRCGQTADRTGEALEALPKCPQCQGLLRPAVVWFNEPLPADAWQRAEHAARSCDLLLVVGTSAVVYPAAGLSEIARAGGASVVEINTERTELSNRVTHGIYGPAGQVLPELVARVGKLKELGG